MLLISNSIQGIIPYIFGYVIDLAVKNQTLWYKECLFSISLSYFALHLVLACFVLILFLPPLFLFTDFLSPSFFFFSYFSYYKFCFLYYFSSLNSQEISSGVINVTGPVPHCSLCKPSIII